MLTDLWYKQNNVDHLGPEYLQSRSSQLHCSHTLQLNIHSRTGDHHFSPPHDIRWTQLYNSRLLCCHHPSHHTEDWLNLPLFQISPGYSCQMSLDMSRLNTSDQVLNILVCLMILVSLFTGKRPLVYDKRTGMYILMTDGGVSRIEIWKSVHIIFSIAV